MQRQRKFSAVLGTSSAKSCTCARRSAGMGFAGNFQAPRERDYGATRHFRRTQRHVLAQKNRNGAVARTSMTMRPAGAPPMVVSKKTVGLGMVSELIGCNNWKLRATGGC